MGNSSSNEKMPSNPIEFFQSTLMNNISIFATMTIIYLFISADKSASYTSMDQFMFMNLITNPHPCDKKNKAKKPEDKAKAAPPAPPAASGIGSALSGAFGGPGGPAALLKGAMDALPPGAPGAAAANAGKNIKGGGTVTDNLTNIASTLNNVGKAINSFTADVKHDLEYESYKVETLSRHKETYCNDMDEMGVFGAFFFIMHSSFLACYNAIQMVNAGIIRLIYFKSEFMSFDMGIFVLYILFFIMSAASTSFLEHITRLIDPSVSLTDSFTREIVLTCFSALISLFFIYFLIAVAAYLEYLIYGMVNIKSEQSAVTFKLLFAFLFFINVMITIPSIFGVNLV